MDLTGFGGTLANSGGLVLTGPSSGYPIDTPFFFRADAFLISAKTDAFLISAKTIDHKQLFRIRS
jgi:hypothetical protein